MICREGNGWVTPYYLDRVAGDTVTINDGIIFVVIHPAGNNLPGHERTKEKMLWSTLI